MSMSTVAPRNRMRPTSTFHPFPRLPFEVRCMIWTLSLVDGRIVCLHHIMKTELRCFPIDRPLQVAELELRNAQLHGPILGLGASGEIWQRPEGRMSRIIHGVGPFRRMNYLEEKPFSGRTIPPDHKELQQVCLHQPVTYCTGFTSPTKLSILYVCREAYSIGNSAFPLAFGTKQHPPTTRFNFEKDTLYIDCDARNLRLVCRLLLPDIDKVKNVAFKFSQTWDRLELTGIFKYDNLKHIILVNEDTSGGIGNLVFTDSRYSERLLEAFSTKRYCPVNDRWVRGCERANGHWQKDMAQLLEDSKSPSYIWPLTLNNGPTNLDIQLKTLMTTEQSKTVEKAKRRWQRDAKSNKWRCDHLECQRTPKMLQRQLDPMAFDKGLGRVQSPSGKME